MKIVLQRVTSALVKVENEVIGKIDKGYVVFLGVGQDDTTAECDRLAEKMVNLRIFSDENDKINLSLKDVDGQLLVISQFTLYADCRKGNRPNFIQAGKPDMAEKLYDYFIEKCRDKVETVQAGCFGADMQVELINDGPFTVILE